MIRTATRDDHKRLCQIARTSKHTSSFSSIMFSSEAAYEKGWIRVLEAREVVGGRLQICGFTCVRHKVRETKTVLYFIAVDPVFRNRRVGEQLMADLEVQTPHRCIALDCALNNPRARQFYHRLGFKTVGEKRFKNGDVAWKMEKNW